jgi:predicted ATPase/DNA-binding SARP family transcriptional activator
VPQRFCNGSRGGLVAAPGVEEHHCGVRKVAEGRTLPRQQLFFRILGPLEVEGEAGPVALVGRKQRALLGLLLLHAGEVVSSDRLVDELWGERPPATAATSLRNLVAQLRRRLGAETIVTRAPGYLLRVEPERLDRARFERLLAEARGAAPRERARLLREALALWRGPPLADLSFERFAQAEIQRLEELRLEALEERIEEELAEGRGGELVAELEALVAAQPLRERLRGQLMLALYRSGRQAEALDAYQTARRMLVEELGVEPSPALQELQGAILRQEPGLAPAPRSEPRTGFPAQPTLFLGRTRELAEIVALLQRADLRLLTLTGAGGSGKTRLALEATRKVADDYRDGVFWVPLAGLRDPALVPASIAHALAITDERRLAETVGGRRLLLVVDNCEHLLEATPALAELLSICPNVNLLATSREPLHLAAEREYLVPTLPESEAVELFRQRAHVAKPEQAALAICRRLDCLPLAIELAAARTKLLRPESLLERLEKRLPLLTGGPRDAPERQRTLEATIAWSHDLLTDKERRLFARLSVFAGGCTLDAAERVCDADLDTLQSLVEKNLLRREGDRFTMLETIREYAAERFEHAHEREDVHRREADYFVRVTETFASERNWPFEPSSEIDNVRAALRWSIRREDAVLALRLAASSSDLFFFLNPREGRRWLEEVLALDHPAGRKVRAEALRKAGKLANEAGDHEAAAEYLKVSLDEWQALDDRRSTAKTSLLLALALWADTPEEVTEPRRLLAQALELFEGLSDHEGESDALHLLGELQRHRGNRARATSLLERARRLTESEFRVASIDHALGDIALDEHDLPRALNLYRNSLATFARRTLNERDIAYCLAGLGAVAAAQWQVTRAGRLAGAVERIRESRGAPLLMPNPSYERLLDATPITPEDVQAGRAMTLDEAVGYALESAD